MALLPEGFDLEGLLAPIAGETPVGADLRRDFTPQSPYYRLRDARAEARAAERAVDAGDPNADPAVGPQRWRAVRDMALKVLAERSKDLEVAAWLTEALVRSEGLAGLTAGALLMAGLAGQYWDELRPLPDEDGIATRVAPVTGLNGEGADGTLMQPLRKITLFQRADGNEFELWQYEQSEELSGISDAKRKASRLAAGVVPFDAVDKEIRAVPPAGLAALRRAAREALAAWTAMSEALDARAGGDSPPTSRVREVIEKLLAIAAKYAPPEPVAPDPAAATAAEAEGEGGAGEAGAAPGVPAAGRAPSREDVLRQLAEIAAYFRRTEPHSPLSYTLEDAIRRGRLSWPELLAELMPEEGIRRNILTSLGIRPE